MNGKYFDQDPKNKMEILQKVIDITRVVTNEKFEVKTTSILKGEEPAKTNYFLQMFHKAATNGKDNSKFIEKYLDHRRKKNEEKKKNDAPVETPSQQIQQPHQEIKKEHQPVTQKPKEKPKGIISENQKDEEKFDNKNAPVAKDSDVAKMKSGTGMKLNKHIFVHDDIMGGGKKEQTSKASKVDLETIKTYVQEITKNSNPIGKIVEFIGDDIELMNKELLNWIKESKSYKEKHDDEIKKSDETLLPLQNELLELEDSIRDEHMQIKSIKSRLIKNEKIIHNLITNVISFKSEQHA